MNVMDTMNIMDIMEIVDVIDVYYWIYYERCLVWDAVLSRTSWRALGK